MEEVKRRKREGTWDENEANLVLSLLAEASVGVADVLAAVDSLFTASSESVCFHVHFDTVLIQLRSVNSVALNAHP